MLIGRVNSGANNTVNLGIALQETIGASVCYLMGRSESTTQHEMYRNGLSVNSSSSLSALPASAAINLFCDSNESGKTSARISFAHIGTGLTDTDASNLSTRVNRLMFDLGANVYMDQGTIDAMGLDADVQAYAEAVLAAGGNFANV
jgi:hypothetical protein